MANSVPFTSGRLYATQLNALRDDVLDETTGHRHTGAADDAPQLSIADLMDLTGIEDGATIVWDAAQAKFVAENPA
jgi:hypothetical protein